MKKDNCNKRPECIHKINENWKGKCVKRDKIKVDNKNEELGNTKNIDKLTKQYKSLLSLKN